MEDDDADDLLARVARLAPTTFVLDGVSSTSSDALLVDALEADAFFVLLLLLLLLAAAFAEDEADEEAEDLLVVFFVFVEVAKERECW